MYSKAVTKNYVDEHVVKLVALQVIVVTLLILFSRNLYLALFLTLDFAIRAFTHLPSPLAWLAKKIAISFHLRLKPVFAAPKKFAATIGFVFSLSISILLFLKLEYAPYSVGSVLGACAFMEAVFNICLGCYVYNWLIVPISKWRSSKTFVLNNREPVKQEIFIRHKN